MSKLLVSRRVNDDVVTLIRLEERLCSVDRDPLITLLTQVIHDEGCPGQI